MYYFPYSALYCFFMWSCVAVALTQFSPWGPFKFNLFSSCFLIILYVSSVCLVLKDVAFYCCVINASHKITNRCKYCLVLTSCVSTLFCMCFFQVEAFYQIFTTEQQDHVKSVEYLRSNFRPIQSLDSRHIFKSAVKDAWLPDLTDSSGGLYGTEASKGMKAETTQTQRLFLHHHDYLVYMKRLNTTVNILYIKRYTSISVWKLNNFF